MYFIAKGDCLVTQKNHKKVEDTLRVIREGDHFGEISLVYRCPRSCSVYARNYNILAKLTRERYKEIVGEYPAYHDYVKQTIQNYSDPQKLFIAESIRKVSYFSKVTDEVMQEVIYSLRPRKF